MTDVARARWQRLVDEALTISTRHIGWIVPATDPNDRSSRMMVWADGRDPGDEDRS